MGLIVYITYITAYTGEYTITHNSKNRGHSIQGSEKKSTVDIRTKTVNIHFTLETCEAPYA